MKPVSVIILLVVVSSFNACKKLSAPALQSNTPAGQAPAEQLNHPAGGTTAVTEVRYFRGSIGSTLGLQMKLTRKGEKVSGSYYYQKIGTRIDLKGTIDKDSNITLEEYDATGKQTGIFKGVWSTDGDGLIGIAGNWTPPNGDKKTVFSIHQEPINFSSGAEITSKSIKETNKKLKYEINAEYPVVGGVPDGRFDKFNQEARNLVAGRVAEFRKQMVEQSKEKSATDVETETTGSDLGVGYEVRLATDDLISVKFDIGSYYQGAAHPNSYTNVLNYDVKAAKVIKLADLFKPGAKYLQAMSSHAVRHLKKQAQAKGADSMLDDEWIGRGAGPDIMNYQSWTITRKGLGINFDSYQVAPYAAGPQYVLIPYSALKDLINPDGLVGQLVK